jgi:CBS domain-containing protein
MLCEEVMKKEVQCCGEKDSVQHAAKRMRDYNVGFLPICDDQAHVLGTITDRDIAIRVVAEGKEFDTLCTDVMSREIVSCGPQDNLLKAEQLMSEHQKSRMLVIDEDGILAGVISLSDIAQHESDRHVARVMREVSDRESFLLH